VRILTHPVKATHCRVHKKGPVGCKKSPFFVKFFSGFFVVKPRVPILGEENL
jgi:hypothetical protein